MSLRRIRAPLVVLSSGVQKRPRSLLSLNLQPASPRADQITRLNLRQFLPRPRAIPTGPPLSIGESDEVDTFPRAGARRPRSPGVGVWLRITPRPQSRFRRAVGKVIAPKACPLQRSHQRSRHALSPGRS